MPQYLAVIRPFTPRIWILVLVTVVAIAPILMIFRCKFLATYNILYNFLPKGVVTILALVTVLPSLQF